MKLLAISEHYFPRVGGTVNYVHETLTALSARGVEVELWVPGPALRSEKSKHREMPSYEVKWIDADYPAIGDPNREQRYRFCSMVNEKAKALAATNDRPHLLHVLFGLFVMEILETEALRMLGLPCIATVHNVPPQECRVVAPNAPIAQRLKESVRLSLVGWKNRGRLRRHEYDSYVTPSVQVRTLLSDVLPDQNVEMIGHGPTGSLLELMKIPETRAPRDGVPVRLLTVGGYAPHKRQHLIPEIASRLEAANVEFEWDVAGPAGRIAGYQKSVSDKTIKLGLSGRVRIHGAVPFSDLAALYNVANIYVQPSIEEGFCITALDAAAAGLPVIASRAGALAMIAELSEGALVESAAEPMADAIIDFVSESRWSNSQAIGARVRSECSWDHAADALHALYRSLSIRRVPVDA